MTDTDRLENKWASRNIVKYDKRKCKILHMGWTNSTQLYRPENSWMRSSFAEKVLMFSEKNRICDSTCLVNRKVNRS